MQLVAGFALSVWAWVELNYRPHAYQARIVEAKVGQDARISL